MTGGVLLDLDRTLVDVQTFTDYEAALDRLPASIGEVVVETPATEWRAATRRAMDVLVALAADERWQDVSDHIESFELAAVPRSTLMPGVFEFLDVVRRLPIAVVTLMGPAAARAALDQHDIALDIVLGREAHHRVKPAPDQLLAACDRVGVNASNVTMIGDSAWDAAAAAAAGCGFIGLTLGKKSEFPLDTKTVNWLNEAAYEL